MSALTPERLLEEVELPVYEYRSTKTGCDYCRKLFQISQRMDDKPLENCPKCNQQVEKVFSPFSLGRNVLSKSYLREHGFTKLVKDDKGGYSEEK